MNEHSSNPWSHGVCLRGTKMNIQDNNGHTNAENDKSLVHSCTLGASASDESTGLWVYLLMTVNP